MKRTLVKGRRGRNSQKVLVTKAKGGECKETR